MDEIVVAKVDRAQIVIATIVASVAVVSSIPFGGWFLRVAAAIAGFLAVRRFTEMRLSVTPTSVVVVNYVKGHRLDLASVRIKDEPQRSDPTGLTRLEPIWLTDAVENPPERTGRLLILTDGSGQEVHVGVSPVYGERRDEIVADLYRAIGAMRSRTD